MRARFLRVLYIVMGVLLCVAPRVWAAEVGPGETLDIESQFTGPLYVLGTVNLKDGGYVTNGMYASAGSTVNITGGGVDLFISVSTGATVTIVGAGFSVTNGTITNDPSADYFTIINIYNPAVLTGTYGGGGEINLTFYSDQDVPIYLAEPQTPEPSQLILDLIGTVATMNLQQGIDNSLDAKLDAALNALDDVNENNDVAAINSMQAFINAVEAQRGNKLTDEQADTLVADAQEIIDLLS